MNLRSTSKLWVVFAALVIVNLLDAATTAVLVREYGALVEANPVVRHWIHLYGIPGLYMVKALVLGILWLVAAYVERFHRDQRAYQTTVRCIVAITVLLSIVVIYNATLIFVYMT